MENLKVIFGTAILSTLNIVGLNIISGNRFTYLYFGFPLILVNIFTLYFCRTYRLKQYLTNTFWSQLLVFILFSSLFISDDYNHLHSFNQFQELSFVSYLLNPTLGLFDELKVLLFFNLPIFILVTAISYLIRIKLTFNSDDKTTSENKIHS